jgi:photosystem II stability/assembly factor-like uncharacterized protein
MNRHTLTALVVATLFAATTVADTPDKEKDKWEPSPALKKLNARCVGPAAGGRVCRVCGVAGEPLTYYAATAGGGVWKSTDGGHSFAPVFDDQPDSSVGSIAVAPSDPNVVYAGGGEANIRGNVAVGHGLYKSTDAGKSWTHVWPSLGQIGTIVVHPTNADIAFAAVLGSPFGPGKERGVYRTTDGGKTWQQVLAKDADTGASDVAIDPNNPRVLFAGLWQTRRKPWEMTSGGPGSGFYVSHDGGDSWTRLKPGEHGLPDGPWGKIGVAVAPSNSQRVYALIEANEGGLYRSDNGGESWKRVCEHRSLRQRAWYYSTITVDPSDPDVLWCPQVPMLKSIDGGYSFKTVRGMHHGDNHDAWIDPKNPKRMIVGNDGGVCVSTDGGKTWTAPPIAISQFYHVNCDTSVPYRVMGNMQDIGTASGPSNSLSAAGIRLSDWFTVGGGETGFVVPDPNEPNVVYAGEYGGYLSRYDHRTKQQRDVSPWPANPSGITPAELKYRFQWTAPLAFSPHDPKVLYYAANVLFRTRDAGQSWEVISGDLTRNDKNKQQWSGGPITGDNTGVEIFDTIFAIAESPKQKGVIWVGSDDGLVHVSQDDGKTWQIVTGTIPDFPDWGTVRCIEPSRDDAGTAYVVAEAHRLNDFRPYLWKTTDFGKTWQSLSATLPQDIHLHAVRADPAKKGMLYAGSERGVAYSTDDGATWQPLKLNLPTMAVHDLQVNGDDLVLGTMGRSIWVIDNITPLRELSPKSEDKSAQLFSIRPATRWRYSGGFSFTDRGAQENPKPGASIDYFIGKKSGETKEASASVKLEILDSKGQMLVTFTGKDDKEREKEEEKDKEGEEQPDGADVKPPKRLIPVEPGVVHRVLWDLTLPGGEIIPKAKLDAGNPVEGILAPPGEYTARLTVDGKPQTVKFMVRPDPRSKGEVTAQVAFAEKIRGDINKLAGVVQQLRAVRKQLRERNDLVADQDKAKDLVKASVELMDKFDGLEEKLHNPKAQVTYDIFGAKGGAKLYSQFAFLFEMVKEGDGPPTQGMEKVYTDVSAELGKLTDEFRSLTEGDLAKLNVRAKELDLPVVIVPPVKPADGSQGMKVRRRD